MASVANKPVSTAKVVLAFAIVYIVWGSTYFFIRLAVQHIPPMLVGAMRFLLAGGLMLLWCVFTGEKIFVWRNIRPSIVSGLLLLFFGNGILIWSEQFLPSSLAAILLASGPIWFVLLDKSKWQENFRSKETITGLLIGFAGIILLFGEPLLHSLSNGASTGAASGGNKAEIIAMIVLIFGSISWASGSLYSKYKSTASSNSVNAGWQMLAAGIVFVPASFLRGEWTGFHWQDVTSSSWLSILYLVTMGSLAGYSAFVWLLRVRSATQVSTHAYVNPVVAVLLGVFFAGESLSGVQLLGLAIILGSVLLINLAKYRTTFSARSKALVQPPESDHQDGKARAAKLQSNRQTV